MLLDAQIQGPFEAFPSTPIIGEKIHVMMIAMVIMLVMVMAMVMMMVAEIDGDLDSVGDGDGGGDRDGGGNTDNRNHQCGYVTGLPT